MEDLKLVRGKNREIIGGVSGAIAGSNQRVEFYSNPFSVPASLTEVPWTDLGEQNYLTVVADTAKIGINPHKLESGIWKRGSVNIPVSIKNTSGQPLIALEYTHLSGTPIERKTPPTYWTAVKAVKPILQPGESISSVCENDLDALEGYKAGDKVVVLVEGRIPNTNQVFQCSSAPLELPALPKDKPPKGALQIPGL